MNQIKIMLRYLLTYFEELLCVAILISLAFVIGAQIVYRYILNNPLQWTDELAGLLNVWLCMFGAVVASKQKRHIIIDFLLKRVNGKWRTILYLISFVLLGALLWILIITGFMVAIRTTFPTVTLPFNWTVVYLCVPISGMLMFYNLIKVIVKRSKW